MTKSEDVQVRAKNNSYDNFRLAMKERIIDFVIDRMEANEKYTHRILGDQEFQSYFIDKIIAEVYTEINAG